MRDLLFEDAFLNEVVKETARRAGIMVEAYSDAVRRRLTLGADTYGDNDYLSKDNLAEALFEGPDLAAYAMLELQKLNRSSGEHEGVHHHLFEASVHAAIADWHTRRAKLARRL